MSTNVSATIKKSVTRARRIHDQKLRNAISLYHLSTSFYPTTGARSPESTSSASAAAGASSNPQAALDVAIDETLHFDIWGSSTAERKPGTRDCLPMFYDGDALLSRFNHVTQAGPRDGSHDEPLVQPELDWLRYDASSSSRGSLAVEKSPRQQAYERLQRSFISQGPSVTKAIDSARPGRGENEPEQTHLQIGGSAAVRKAQLDDRSARIRDALFGTVGGGEKPGLEVLRERVARHQQQEKQER